MTSLLMWHNLCALVTSHVKIGRAFVHVGSFKIINFLNGKKIVQFSFFLLFCQISNTILSFSYYLFWRMPIFWEKVNISRYLWWKNESVFVCSPVIRKMKFLKNYTLFFVRLGHKVHIPLSTNKIAICHQKFIHGVESPASRVCIKKPQPKTYQRLLG